MTVTTISAARPHPATCSCEEGAGAWYVEYGPMLRRYLMTRVQDQQAAEECTNETFLRAIANRRAFNCTGDGVRPWLFTIARNVAYDYHRKAWRRLETPVEVTDDRRDDAPTPEQATVLSYTAEELARCVDELPGEQGDCVRLRFFDGLSVEQTARVMHRQRGAVRALQYRAMRNLAQLVAKSSLASRREEFEWVSKLSSRA